jgi:serine/threonine-protein kinase RsbW
MAETANVRLTLPSRPENVLVVRQALNGVAAAMGLNALELNDINTAVTEACNNVVTHAYGDEEGPLLVEVLARAGAIVVSVRDRGSGMQGPTPEPVDDAEGQPVGLGLAVIDTLSRDVRISRPSGGGTEVRMEFTTPRVVALEPIGVDETDEWAGPNDPRDVDLRVSPKSLARAVFPRVLLALAARAHFSTERIADVQLVADAIAANAADSIDGACLAVSIDAQPRKLQLSVGPLHADRRDDLVSAAADGLAPALERLCDGTHAAHNNGAGSGETLVLDLVDRR